MDYKDSSKQNYNKMLENIEKTEIDRMKSTLAKLYSVWSDIGMKEDQMTSRVETLFYHIHGLVQDIYEEEVSLHTELKGQCITLFEDVSRLARNLDVPFSTPDAPLIQKIKLMKLELNSLNELKKKRIQDLMELRLVEKKYSKLLGIEEFQLSSNTEIPSTVDLNELQSHIDNMSKEHIIRYDKYIEFQKEILSILDKVEIPPENRLEEYIFSGSQPDCLSKDTLMLVNEILEKVKKRKNEIEKQKNDLIAKLTTLYKRLNIENRELLSNYPDLKVASLKDLQQEIKKCEELKRKDIESFINVLREELKDIWNKCGVSDSEKNFFPFYLTTQASEDNLVAYEEEVDKWKKYYENLKPLLAKIQKLNKLWELLRALDEKANDPKRLKNRGGNLLKEEKERNRLLKTLPALENQIFQEIENYEKETGKEFIYKEENYKLLITKQWQERSNQKENLKLDKQFPPTIPASPKLPICNTPSEKPSRPYTLTRSNPRFPIYRSTTKARTPKTVTKTIKKRELDFVKAVNILETNQNLINVTTTYSNFAKELNNSARCNFRSSVLTSKKVAGTRMSMSPNNRSRSELKKFKKRQKKSGECPF